MKKYILYLFIAVVTLSWTTSCNDLMDLPSDGRTSLEEIFAERRGVMGYLNSCYGHCPAPYMDRASMTDEAQDADDITANSKPAIWYTDGVSAQNFGSYSSDGSPWTSLYQGIKKCNVFLERMQTVTTSTIQASEDEIGGWKAQAHTLRALYYLQLIKRYGSAPLLKAAYEQDHDYSKDQRASFSKVVEFILEDCDAALAFPDKAFGWGVPESSFGIITRSVPYAIKSQAITYAASPLWSDGTYTWEEATDINKEALYALTTHDHALFSTVPQPDIAHNPYALYFISSSNDRRSADKETIYQVGNNMEVWRYAGLPSTPGMIKSGPCPTQELVDSYEMQNTGLAPFSGYTDSEHLRPIANAASGYNPDDPYAGRDPRFYASIYYNGALKTLGAAGQRDNDFPITDAYGQNDLLLLDKGGEDADGMFWGVISKGGGDPYMYLQPGDMNIDWSLENKITFSFRYKSAGPLVNSGMYFVVNGGIDPTKNFKIGDIPASAPDGGGGQEWTDCVVDLSKFMKENFSTIWNGGAYLRFDFMKGHPHDYYFQIRDIKMNVSVEGSGEPPVTVYTYEGGSDGISVNDRRKTRTGYYMRKFNNWKSNVNNNADGAIRLFRLAEIYLNFAESAYHSHGPDVKVSTGDGAYQVSAREAVNVVRSRAGMPDFPEGMSNTEFEKKYRNERRVELAFEEHRYFDVRRWKILDQTDKFVTGMKITPTADPDKYNYERISFSRASYKDKYYLYPIDQSDVDKMQEFTGTNWQNQGW